jgi:hypothetical protein
MSNEVRLESFATWALIAQLGIAGATDTAVGRSVPAGPMQSVMTAFSAQEMKEMPRIEVISKRPANLSPNAEAFINADGGDVIYIVGDSAVYKAAKSGDKKALIKLAGIVAHERYHLEHGPDEGPAYDAEISMLRRVGADSSLVQGVIRAKDTVLKAQRARK